MENNIKKVFLLCAERKKPYHLKNLKARYKSQIHFTDRMADAELILCIEHQQLSMLEKEKLLQAKEMGIKISYFTEELLPEKEIVKELYELEYVSQQTLKEEITFSGEEL